MLYAIHYSLQILLSFSSPWVFGSGDMCERNPGPMTTAIILGRLEDTARVGEAK